MRCSTTGWIQFWRKRRKQLRARGGLSLAPAGHVALLEVRCRTDIAKVIGKPAAKIMELQVGLQRSDYDPIFIVTDETSWDDWHRLKGIPRLLRAVASGAPVGNAQATLAEAQCRKALAEFFGRPAADNLPLQVCMPDDVSNPMFLLPAGTPWSLWQQLQVIPNLLFPFGTSPQP